METVFVIESSISFIIVHCCYGNFKSDFQTFIPRRDAPLTKVSIK